MTRTIREVEISPGRIRYTVTIKDTYETVVGSQDANIRQLEVMRTLADTPQLVACGYEPYQTLQIFHDGSRWTMVAEAEIVRPVKQ